MQIAIARPRAQAISTSFSGVLSQNQTARHTIPLASPLFRSGILVASSNAAQANTVGTAGLILHPRQGEALAALAVVHATAYGSTRVLSQGFNADSIFNGVKPTNCFLSGASLILDVQKTTPGSGSYTIFIGGSVYA